MARTARDHPLRAAPRYTPLADGGVDPDADIGSEPSATSAASPGGTAAGTRRRRLRSAVVGLGVGSAVLVAGVAIAFSIVAIPLYLLASTDPGHGLDRDLVRKGLFYVALPFGMVGGVLSGLVVGVWYGRGGRLPTHRQSFYDT